jgi:hypothetical protein
MTMKPGVVGQHISLSRALRDAGEKALIALEAFTGLTALAGGVLLMARPDGSLLQVAPTALAALGRNSPFADFLVPGLALAAIVGGGMLAAATLLMKRRPLALEAAMAAGGALVVFEIVEFAAIGFMPLQAVEAIVGLLVMGLAARSRLAMGRPGRRASHPAAA